MSRDIMILVVHFLQKMHSMYDDFWRFTPTAVKNMFEENVMRVLYLNFNDKKNASVYIFCFASRYENKWCCTILRQFSIETSFLFDRFEPSIECKAVMNSFTVRVLKYFYSHLFIKKNAARK